MVVGRVDQELCAPDILKLFARRISGAYDRKSATPRRKVMSDSDGVHFEL